jgi:hypothetical protein
LPHLIASLLPISPHLLKLVAFVLFAWYDRFAPYVLAEKHNLKPMIDKQTFCYPLAIGKISQKEGNKWIANASNAVMIMIYSPLLLSIKFV